MTAPRIGWQVAAWALLVALQLWSLQRIAHLEAALAAQRKGAPSPMPGVAGEPPPPSPMDAAMAASLARIESRLAAGDGSFAPSAAAPRQGPAPAMPREVADARLAALLPAGGALSEGGFESLRARIMALPDGERLPISLALSRAINRGAVRMVP